MRVLCISLLYTLAVFGAQVLSFEVSSLDDESLLEALKSNNPMVAVNGLIAKKPTSVFFRLGKIELLIEAGKLQDAKSELENLYKQYPRSYEVAVDLMTVFLLTGDLENASKLLKVCESSDPRRYASDQLNVISLELHGGIKEIEDLIKTSAPDNLAAIYRRSGRFEDALSILTSDVGHSKDRVAEVSFRFKEGMTNLALGRIQKSSEIFSNLLLKNVNFISANAELQAAFIIVVLMNQGLRLNTPLPVLSIDALLREEKTIGPLMPLFLQYVRTNAGIPLDNLMTYNQPSGTQFEKSIKPLFYSALLLVRANQISTSTVPMKVFEDLLTRIGKSEAWPKKTNYLAIRFTE